MFWRMITGTRNLWKKRKVRASEQAMGKLASHRVEVRTVSDIGCHRDNNEDRITSFQPSEQALLDRKGILTVVADGMGGHSAGEVASHIAVEIISRIYYEDQGDPSSALQGALVHANAIIYQTAQRESRLKGMGTTCTALVIQDNVAFCAHVGDSRLYLIREGDLFLMTEDHTAVMQMVKTGLISDEEARHHPEKHILLCALGTKPEVTISSWAQPFPVRTGDVFVLCSDGLYDLVSDEEIRQMVLSSEEQETCGKLIALAKERGGFDNISVGLVSIQPASDSSTTDVRVTRVA